MTQPSALDKTFDTSLIDTNDLPTFERSFSSTETNTSGGSTGNKPNSNLNKADPDPTKPSSSTTGPSTMPDATQQQHQQLPTTVSNDRLYDEWASTYDTDGNVLQAVDDLELKTLLPEFVRLTSEAIDQRAAAREGGEDVNGGESKLRVLDLGCGTGRNTVKLLTANWSGAGDEGGGEVSVEGWDGSEAMLEVARQKRFSLIPTLPAQVSLADPGFQRVDFSDPQLIPISYHASFSGIISTLVLEHLPLPTFFGTLARLLAPGGVALVTNMHPDMFLATGAVAGYKTSTGERVKGSSYVHGVAESAQAAREAGLEVVNLRAGDVEGVRERAVDEGMVERGEVGERGRKWVGTRVWYGFLLRKREKEG